MRACSRCRVIRPLEDFWKHGSYTDGRKRQCKVCEAETRKVRKQKDPTVIQRSRLKRLYDLPLETYNEMFLQQGGKCFICWAHQSSLNKALHVDHCHETGKVRGLLCQKCNHGIGLFQDNPKALSRAIEYLSNSSLKLIKGGK